VRFVRLLLALLALTLIVLTVPTEQLPVSWQAVYFSVLGERVYTSAPRSAPAQHAPLDLDQVCPPENGPWREAVTIAGVGISAVEDCLPDNPYDVAVSVLGGNNAPHDVLMQSLLAPDAVEKSDDRDGDGDPDLIHIRLEVMELNGVSPDSPELVPQFEIAPGILPGLWVFAPKSRGMTTINLESPVSNRLVRAPSPSIRVEQGDEVFITLENTHYLPHTLHLHGVDHSFKQADGSGNDGVPLWSETPVAPGAARQYHVIPRYPGTAFYHCHVQPHTHILMGLQGMFIVEENRPNNTLQTFNIGGGRVRVPSVAAREQHAREYDLHYFEIDRDLNEKIQRYTDPRLTSREVHRGYNVTQRVPEYFLLNGRSFPFTLRESLVVMESDKQALLHVLNGGNEAVSLHFHGHKPLLSHVDGVALVAPEQRDVFWIPPAQRFDLTVSGVNDGRHSYGPGAWLMHDHREQAVTSDGIGPGGDISLLVYADHLGSRGLPLTATAREHLGLYFDPDYYRGRLPVFTGMGLDELAPPASRGGLELRRLGFVAGVMLLLALWIWRRRDRL